MIVTPLHFNASLGDVSLAETQALPWPLTAGALVVTVVGLTLIRAPKTAPKIATTN